jgi:hypothetical protein
VKHLLIILSIILLTSPLFGQEAGALYQYKTTSGLIWKTFGKGKIQPKYEGEITNGSPDGFGVLSYPFTDGKSIVGEWKVGNEWNTEHYNNDGKLIGKLVTGKWILTYGVLCGTLKAGKTVWAEKCYAGSESKYFGDIENMKPNGQGTNSFQDGREYLGGWKDGKEHGQGTLNIPNGYSFTGGFKDGKLNGRGTETFPNRYKYVGGFKNGKRRGQGKLTTPDGVKYLGAFKNGEKNGKGTLTTPDGVKYLGAFKNGKKNGKGTLTSLDGFKYVGKFKNGEKNGTGTLISPGGFKYVGTFKNGKKNGTGTFTWPDGGKYKGDWKDGKFHGQGSFTFADKNIGVGEFRKNKPWNILTYDKAGKIIWQMKHGVRVKKGNLLKIEKGILFRDTPHAKWVQGGEIWFNSGDVKTQAKYEGDISAGFPEGHGTLTFPSGSKYTGDFREGKPWNVITYDKNGKISYKFVNGKRQ